MLDELSRAERREFLRSAAVAGGGLILSVALPGRTVGAAAADAARGRSGSADSSINAFVKIGTDGTVTLVMHKSEMGQGVYTGLAQLLGEE